MEYIYLILLWCLWCTLHSVMISLTITNYLKNRMGSKYRFYRLIFNLISLTTLMPVAFYSTGLKSEVLFQWSGFSLIIQSLLMIIVVTLFFAGLKKYDMLQFLGIRQIKSGNSHILLSATGDIDTSGIFRLTRHPWYLAVIIFIWLRDIYVSTLIINLILTVYIVIGTVLEENKIIAEYGTSYRRYQEKVSMLFPFKWLFSKKLF
ncbi:isoprenylcysteine carboxylmethyltransferase family protein [Sporomusa sp. KB1]|uniref:methyltransferase family protein n=1 Tax=Sporomusa sp. KB1 TaxID=943346 RepID=UPI0011A2BF3A|nr:NnrU family protein [Sporomusa sp. KB1]TWH51811.1 NnrU protein [Sporomusa sp. KB1]